ncbi:hypothetical protein [Campylobacter coli]|uniref:hypothetical protein n=1 Tax=Campylobacter coli TaxID=195 RepID=UPI00294A7A67|nr:hypothetical protein [Campylobacter coli]MDV6136448.1 hypothetical protein [Campylobacter coli]
METQDSIKNFQESLYEGLEEQDDKENEIYPIKDIKIEKKSFSVYCRRKNKISIWKNKTSIKVEILFFYKP